MEGKNWDEIEESYVCLIKEFDLLDELRIKNVSAVRINDYRLRSSYAKRSTTLFKKNLFKEYETDEEYFTSPAFRTMFAYLVLRDNERKRLYFEHGFRNLLSFEKYNNQPVFLEDPYEVFESFFEGRNPEDREWLLMNGSSHFSEDDESDEEDIELIRALSTEVTQKEMHGYVAIFSALGSADQIILELESKL
eukprot:snap_masked-scaffold_43-processed-gene-1.63-mRNA-1 protein AED:1.00 eAED:1.00 QI:0/0/0/0/1/1/2/0/192